jgi:hypothetical protein
MNMKRERRPKKRAKTDEALLSHARPIPLTDQIRLKLKEAQGLVASVREALAEGDAGLR